MQAQTIRLLACPACHGGLTTDDASGDINDAPLVCGCGRAYPVRDGVAVLLAEETGDIWRDASARLDEALATEPETRHRLFDTPLEELNGADLTFRGMVLEARGELEAAGEAFTAADPKLYGNEQRACADRLLDACVARSASAPWVVDIASGRGALVERLARAGREVLATDISPVAMIRLRARLIGLGLADRVDCIAGDAAALPVMTQKAGGPRLPAHARSFYPAEPDRLRDLVERQLAEAADRLPDVPGVLVGGLAPHAGLEYSGAIAARTWAMVAAAHPETIVLAGTDHAGTADGVAVWTGGPWRCPIGEIDVDGDLAAEIVALGEPFVADDVPHATEHSLEVQLPFLAVACPDVRIVPCLVGHHGVAPLAGAAARLGELLAALDGEAGRIVIVASSDFAHYPDASAAVEITREMLGAIERLDDVDLARREAELPGRGIPGLVCGMCGLAPVLFTLGAVRAVGAERGETLGRATSADVPHGDPRRTVGYGAAVFVR